MKLLVINGPNVNLLGLREPALYGREDYPGLVRFIREAAVEAGVEVDCFQSNHEGAIVDAIQAAYGQYDGIIINPAAYTHTSVAILDALKAVALPAAEVHLTDVSKREEFRRLSYAGMACAGHFIGLGFEGYRRAILFLKDDFAGRPLSGGRIWYNQKEQRREAKDMSKFILTGFGDEISPDLDIQMDVMEKLSIRHIEFRAAYGKNVADHTLEEIRAIKEKMDARGFQVSAVGSPIGKIGINDPFDAHLEKFLHVVDIAKAFGTKYIRLFSFFIPEGEDPARYREEVMRRMKALVAAAAGKGVILLHENERYIYGDTPERCEDILKTVNSPILRMTYDPANFVHCEVENYPHAFGMLKHSIEYMHIKDCVYQKTQRVLDMGFENVGDMQRVPGEGEANLKQILSELWQMGFEGYLSIEPHLTDKVVPGTGADKFAAAANGLKKLIKGIEEA